MMMMAINSPIGINMATAYWQRVWLVIPVRTVSQLTGRLGAMIPVDGGASITVRCWEDGDRMARV